MRHVSWHPRLFSLASSVLSSLQRLLCFLAISFPPFSSSSSVLLPLLASILPHFCPHFSYLSSSVLLPSLQLLFPPPTPRKFYLHSWHHNFPSLVPLPFFTFLALLVTHHFYLPFFTLNYTFSWHPSPTSFLSCLPFLMTWLVTLSYSVPLFSLLTFIPFPIVIVLPPYFMFLPLYHYCLLCLANMF